MNQQKIKWACPGCGAPPHKCGKGECESTIQFDGSCEGFVCECACDTAKDHGKTFADPCRDAHCYHCGWGGTFPKKPKGLQPWEKQALDAGWAPPKKRAVELGMVVGKKGGT